MSKKNAVNRWTALTWDELESWAGGRTVARGQAYQRDGRVQGLAITVDGRLLATVAEALKRMRPILEALGRKEEWTNLLTEIRTQYRNRPRFMEILDRLEGRTILETHKKRRR